jgi:hypothetical protein
MQQIYYGVCDFLIPLPQPFKADTKIHVAVYKSAKTLAERLTSTSDRKCKAFQMV